MIVLSRSTPPFVKDIPSLTMLNSLETSSRANIQLSQRGNIPFLHRHQGMHRHLLTMLTIKVHQWMKEERRWRSDIQCSAMRTFRPLWGDNHGHQMAPCCSYLRGYIEMHPSRLLYLLPTCISEVLGRNLSFKFQVGVKLLLEWDSIPNYSNLEKKVITWCTGVLEAYSSSYHADL